MTFWILLFTDNVYLTKFNEQKIMNDKMLLNDTVGFNFCEEQSYGATEHIKQTSSNVTPTSTFVRLTCTGWYAWMQVFLINFFEIIYFVVYCLWSEILWKPMQGKQEEENLSVGTRSCGHLEKVCQSCLHLLKSSLNAIFCYFLKKVLFNHFI